MRKGGDVGLGSGRVGGDERWDGIIRIKPLDASKRYKEQPKSKRRRKS